MCVCVKVCVCEYVLSVCIHAMQCEAMQRNVMECDAVQCNVGHNGYRNQFGIKIYQRGWIHKLVCSVSEINIYELMRPELEADVV